MGLTQLTQINCPDRFLTTRPGPRPPAMAQRKFGMIPGSGIRCAGEARAVINPLWRPGRRGDTRRAGRRWRKHAVRQPRRWGDGNPMDSNAPSGMDDGPPGLQMAPAS